VKLRPLAPSPLAMLDLAGMTFPRYRPLLASEDERVVLYVAEIETETVALAIAIADANEASLLSLFVRPAHRKQGIGRQLLDALENALSVRGCEVLATSWTSSTPGQEAFPALLQRQAWSSPIPRMVIYYAELSQLGQARWMQQFAALPEGHALVPWSELSPKQLAQLRQAIRFEEWVPKDLVPFDFEGIGIDGAASEPRLNLACVAWGEVVGWNFAHRIDEETARISCTYVRPDLQNQLFMLAIWQEAFNRLSGTNYRRLSWAVAVERSNMVNFNDKYMVPYLSNVTKSWESRKELPRSSPGNCDS